MRLQLLFYLIAIITCILACSKIFQKPARFEQMRYKKTCSLSNQLIDDVVIPENVKLETSKAKLLRYNCFLNKILTFYIDTIVNEQLAADFAERYVARAIEQSRRQRVYCIEPKNAYSLLYGFYLLQTLFLMGDENFEIEGVDGSLSFKICQHINNNAKNIPVALSAAVLQLIFIQHSENEKIKVYYEFYN